MFIFASENKLRAHVINSKGSDSLAERGKEKATSQIHNASDTELKHCRCNFPTTANKRVMKHAVEHTCELAR